MPVTNGPIFRAAWDQREEIREFRELLHKNPELAWQERETTEHIGNALDSFGVEARVSATGTGVIAEIGPADGDVVLLRSDIDALSITEANDVSYRSQNDGVMHACGHDVTAAGLVHAAAMLKDYDHDKGLPNKVRLLFQPAEESGNGGAESMIRQDDVLQDVKAAFGLHSWPGFYVGEIGTREGTTQNGYRQVQVEVEEREDRRGGHSSRPELTRNLAETGPLMGRAARYQLYKLYPNDNEVPVMAWTSSIFASDAVNAMPWKGSLRGTFRARTLKGHENGPSELTEIFDRMAAESGMTVRTTFTNPIPPVVNTPWAKRHVDSVLAAEIGRDAVREFSGSSGGDDMSFYGTGVPGIKGAPELHYAQLGVVPRGRDLASYPDLHTSKFDVHPHAPMYAAVHYAALGVAGLSGHPGNRGPEHQLERSR